MNMEERRSSRIPRSGIPSNGVPADRGKGPLTEKAVNTMSTSAAAVDRKRKAGTMDAIPEAKRPAAAGGPRPARSAPAPPAAAASASVANPSFHSEGAKPGPAPGEETFDDIKARTGASEADILNKKLAWKKGVKPEKKVEEMVPVIKELRAVGWHLLSERDRAAMDVQQWQGHCAKLEAELETEREGFSKRQDEVEKTMKEIQGMLETAEGNNSKLTSELAAAEAMVTQKAEALSAAQANLASVQAELDRMTRTASEREAKIKEMEDVVRQSQSYASTLQSYNTSLQNDLKEEKSKRDEAARERDLLQGKAAELGGMCRSLEQQLTYERDQVTKLREEREQLARDVAVLRTDLDTTRQERDRLLSESAAAKAEVERIRAAGGKSLETLEALTNDKATMEVQLTTQQRLLGEMRAELALAKEHRALAESQAGTRGTQISEMQAQIKQLQEALTDAETKVLQGEMVRRKLHNVIQELKGNIRVFCRVRPLSSLEAGPDGTLAVELGPTTADELSAGITLLAPNRNAPADTPAMPARHAFNFDRVFGPTATQEAVFEEISELVQSALDGHKVCIFAYGQTGSGKTYTMLGTPDSQGMIPKAMHQVFDTSRKLASQGWTFTMHASMLEIYNEEYRDLLAKGGRNKEEKKHQVIHNADGSTTVTDLVSVDVSTPAKVDALLADAMEKRSVGCTNLNEHSSRSHMVFTLKIDGSNSTTGQVVAGVLNLIDLAGSERVKESGATGQQLKEAQAINKSLSSLGDVIVAIANKEKHVPFRNSKLTYLLQTCLGGDAKTLMFVNIAPSREFAPESLCSLRFAAKVNACEINPRRQQAGGGNASAAK